jgi:ABC-type lipoprotein release transport system permease subunit
MSLTRLVFQEIRYRLFSFALGTLAVTAAVALYVGLVAMGRASYDETKRLMRNLGFNLIIVPAETDMVQFWATDYPEGDMPEQYVRKLAATPGMGADHYVAMLQKWVRWRGRDVLLTGILPEYTAVDAGQKAPMGYKIGRGKCYLGYVIAQSWGLKPKDTLNLFGKKLTVEQVLLEDGSKEDARLYAHLHDVQEMLGMKGRINTIQALNCLCDGGSLEVVRAKIKTALPDVHVTQMRDIAEVRIDTRRMVGQYAEVVLGVALVICAAWIGLLSMLNVRERRREIGIMRALGFGSEHIAGLFLMRAAAMGLVGAVVGFVIGSALTLHFGSELFKFTFKNLNPDYVLLLESVVVAPVIAALAALLPAIAAVTQDPAVILMEE